MNLLREEKKHGGNLGDNTRANTACTRPSGEHQDHAGGSLCVFRHFAWLEAGSGKTASSRPAHQRVTLTVRLLSARRDVKNQEN